MGNLANKTLRTLRSLAHQALDRTWDLDGIITRNEAYAWLAYAMDSDEYSAHIGMMDEGDCLKVVDMVHRLYVEAGLLEKIRHLPVGGIGWKDE